MRAQLFACDRRPTAGALQLDVLKERLKNEYGIPIEFELSRFTLARWVSSADARDLDAFMDKNGSAMDGDGAPVFLAPTAYGLRYEEERYPGVRFADVKTDQARGGTG